MNNSLLGFILLILSLSGWGMFTYYKLKINPAFIPIFVFSFITCAIFSAGLLNFIPLMTKLIFCTGLLLFAVSIYLVLMKKLKLKELFVPSILFFIISSIYFTILLKGVILLHYDNFSHWGLIVKEMFRINNLPDNTTLITFRNYPPGSAVFIYFIGKIIGYSESHALMGQAYLISSCLAVLFCFCNWKKPGHIILHLIASITLILVIKNNIYDLLVDTLLGVLALSITVITFYYKNNLKKGILTNLPLLVLLVLVKDTGKIFLAINILIIFLFYFKYYLKGSESNFNQKKKLLYTIIFALLVPLFFSFLWGKYTERVYPANALSESKFALSIDKITEVHKSPQLISSLAPKIIQAATNPVTNNVKSFYLLCGSALFFLVFFYLRKRRISNIILGSMLFSIFVYCIYILFLYFVYLFLMPEGEAQYLAGFERYQSTIIIYCIGILTMSILYEWSRLSSSIKEPIISIFSLLLFSLIIIFPFANNIDMLIKNPDIKSSVRFKVKNEYEKISHTGAVNPTVLYYSPESKGDNGYLNYLLVYEQHSSNFGIIRSLSTRQEEDYINLLMKNSNYLYLVILKSDQYIKKCLSPYLHKENLEGTYLISHNQGNMKLIPLK